MDTVKKDYILAAQALAEMVVVLVASGRIPAATVQPQLDNYRKARDKWLDTV